jgi:hypothetical protein
MDLKCSFEQDFETLSLQIENFQRRENDIVIRPVSVQKDLTVFGCYLPTIPGLSGMMAGRLLLRRLTDNLVELQVVEVQDWAEAGIMALIDYLSEG